MRQGGAGERGGGGLAGLDLQLLGAGLGVGGGDLEDVLAGREVVEAHPPALARAGLPLDVGAVALPVEPQERARGHGGDDRARGPPVDPGPAQACDDERDHAAGDRDQRRAARARPLGRPGGGRAGETRREGRHTSEGLRQRLRVGVGRRVGEGPLDDRLEGRAAAGAPQVARARRVVLGVGPCEQRARQPHEGPHVGQRLGRLAAGGPDAGPVQHRPVLADGHEAGVDRAVGHAAGVGPGHGLDERSHERGRGRELEGPLAGPIAEGGPWAPAAEDEEPPLAVGAAVDDRRQGAMVDGAGPGQEGLEAPVALGVALPDLEGPQDPLAAGRAMPDALGLPLAERGLEPALELEVQQRGRALGGREDPLERARQGVAHLRRRLPAGAALAGQRAHDHGLERRRDLAGRDHARRERVLRDPLADERRRVVAGEGRAAGDRLVDHEADGEQVAPGVARLAGRLLGAHVARGPDHARAREAAALAGRREVARAGQAEVEEPDVVVVPDHDVVGLEVAVDDLPAVGLGHGVEDLADDLAHAPGRERPLVLQELPQGPTRAEVHQDVEAAVGGLAELADLGDVLVHERGRCGPRGRSALGSARSRSPRAR